MSSFSAVSAILVWIIQAAGVVTQLTCAVHCEHPAN